MTSIFNRSGIRRNMTAVMALGVFSLLAWGSNDDKQASGAPSSGSASRGSDVGKTAASAAPVGTKLVVGGLETEIVRASMDTSSGDHTAGEGATLLVVVYRVKNTTNEAVQAASFADAAINAQGQSFEPSMDCNLRLPDDTPTLGFTDTLNPGLPKSFGVCFEVPAGSTGWVMKVNRSFEDGFLQTGS